MRQNMPGQPAFSFVPLRGILLRMKTPFAKFALGSMAAASLLAAAPALAADTQTVQTLSVTAGIRFSKQFGLGASNADVRDLQRFLNSSSATRVAEMGTGSPGNESMYFGPATRRAVQAFQKSQGIASTGYVGPLTLDALNKYYNGSDVKLPTVYRLDVAQGAPGTATVSLSYAGGGEAPSVWFAFGASPSATSRESSKTDGNKHAGSLSSTLTDLASGQEYFVRAYLKNSAGTTESQVVGFKVVSY